MDPGGDLTSTTNAPGALDHPAAPMVRATRKPLPVWDRVKILVLLAVLFGLFVWNDTSTNPIIPIADAMNRQLEQRWWLLLLVAVELVRQAHYLLSEIWGRWHHLWTERIFGGINRRTGAWNPWTRFRLGRVIRWAVVIFAVDIAVAAATDLELGNALTGLPALVWQAMPMIAQVLVIMFVAVGQFVAIFWFLSRGGVDVYMPDDIDTRFTDVWGQDNVLERVKENMVFLDDPESIESKGGHVPSGILLWGPPGTGKTLMAEAVAGETGKPYVFVDPGAFAQPLTARVLTPGGWRKMGEIAFDDLVIGRDGRSTRVRGVFPQGERDIFRVTFSDGGSTRVTADHLWAVQTPWLREIGSECWQIRRTSDLDDLRVGPNGWRFTVPVVAPVELDSRAIDVDPFDVGRRLAADRLSAFALRLPDDYLQNGCAVRSELLRGLLSHGDFESTSSALCDDVVELVRSLGGIATVEPRTLCTEVGAMHRSGCTRADLVHTVTISLPGAGAPVQRFITSIEPDGREPAQCILVEADDHLYVTDEFIVTHNTAMFMGVGIMKVKSLFRKLRKLALRYGGVIVFFDEADSLGNRGQLATGGPGGFMTPWQERLPDCNGLRYLTPESQLAVLKEGFVMGAGMGGGGGMGTLQALLSELSGLKKPRGFLNRHGRRVLGMKPKPPPKYRILVMMATNMPQALDEALLRPGRIDRIYKVGYPSKVGRIRTYQGYLAKVAHTLTEEQVDRLATITPYATGATIKDLVNEALINAIRDGREVIGWSDVVKAKQLKDLGPPEDVEYIERERHAVAIHEACHAVIAYRVRRHLTIDIATIEKGGSYLGMVASIPPEDQFTRWRTEYEADIMVSLASLAGERMFFDGDNSSGVSGDLESATMIATMMEGYWGMGSTVASHGVTHRVGIGGGGKPGAPELKEGDKDLLAGSLGRRIEVKLDELLSQTNQLLADDRGAVLAVAHALETNKTVTGEDIEAIIEGQRGPLIDGRMYHEPEFLQLAERYHRDALTAHEGHAKVELALPLPSVWWRPPAEESDEPPYTNGHIPTTTTVDASPAPIRDEPSE